MQMTCSLVELRALRNHYRAGAIRALEKRWRFPMAAFIDEVASRPFKHTGGIAVYADTIADITDWAALTRFMHFALLVWEAESERVADLPPWRAA